MNRTLRADYREPSVGPAPWGAVAGLDSHQQAEIEAGHMKQVALLDVLASSEPDPAPAASPVQRMLEAPFDQFRPLFSHGLSDHRRYPDAVVVHGASRLMVATPRVQTVAFGLSDSRPPWPTVQTFEDIPGEIAFVRDQFRRIVRAWRCGSDPSQTFLSGFQRLLQSRGVPLVRFLNLDRNDRAGVQAHRVLWLVRQMRSAILHLGYLRLGIDL